MKTSTTGFIVAGDDDLLLLHGQGQISELRIFSFKDGGVKTVVILVPTDQIGPIGGVCWRLASTQLGLRQGNFGGLQSG